MISPYVDCQHGGETRNRRRLVLFACRRKKLSTIHVKSCKMGFDAVVQVLEGEAEIRIGGKPLAVKAGETVVMPADVPHALHATERFKIYCGTSNICHFFVSSVKTLCELCGKKINHKGHKVMHKVHNENAGFMTL